MDQDTKKRIIEQAELYSKLPSDLSERLGEATDMKCSCGGVLHRESQAWAQRLRMSLAEAATPNKPPGHRKNRIRKKLRQRYERKRRVFIAWGAAIMAPISRPFGGTYYCASCGKRDGGYAFIARRMFTVEPMPPGALPIYDKDPDVAGIVTRTFVSEDLPPGDLPVFDRDPESNDGPE